MAALNARTGVRLTYGSGRWAACPGGEVALLGSVEDRNRPGHWFFGVNAEEFRGRRALGVILLAERGGDLLDFGIPRNRVERVLPTLSLSGGEAKLNLYQEGDAFVLRTPGTNHDLTTALGDLSWLVEGCPPTGDGGSAVRDAATLGVGAGRSPGTSAARTASGRNEGAGSSGTERSFFARVRGGVLEPLDDPGLEEGALVLVATSQRPSAPANPLLRRLVARGGPPDLPPDLAERHDRYAHGAGGAP